MFKQIFRSSAISIFKRGPYIRCPEYFGNIFSLACGKYWKYIGKCLEDILANDCREYIENVSEVVGRYKGGLIEPFWKCLKNISL